MFKLVQDHYIKYSRPLMYREEREEFLGFSFLQKVERNGNGELRRV
jgi:hypothetical protein